MRQSSASVEELEDWQVLRSFLPEGWEQKAHESGALTRARGITGADALLRVLLIHIANGCSLVETSVRAQQMGLGQLNASAIYKRLRSAEEWLRWMADQLRTSLGMIRPETRESCARGRCDSDFGARQHGDGLENSLRRRFGDLAVRLF